MHARVARFTGSDRKNIEKNVAGIRGESAAGPPEGVPAKSLLLLSDKDSGTVIAVTFYDSDEDMRAGDAVFNEMSPPQGSMGSRSSVDLCEVDVQMDAP